MKVRGGGEVNLSVASQDLYYGFKLYETFNRVNIKNVVLFFSVFSPGACLLKTLNRNQCILYKQLFHIGYQYDDIANENKFFQKEPAVQKMVSKELGNQTRLEKRTEGTLNYRKKIYRGKHKSKIHNVALKNLKNNKRKISQMGYLRKLIDETERNKQKFVIVLSPATNAYKEVLPPPNELFSEVFQLVKGKKAKVFNGYDCPLFENDSFADGDHLNNKGAHILTEQVKKILNETKTY